MNQEELKAELGQLLNKRYSKYTDIKVGERNIRVKIVQSEYPKITKFQYDKDKDELQVILTNEQFELEELTEDVYLLVAGGIVVGFIIKQFSRHIELHFAQELKKIEERKLELKESFKNDLNKQIRINQNISFITDDILMNKNLDQYAL